MQHLEVPLALADLLVVVGQPRALVRVRVRDRARVRARARVRVRVTP